MADTRLLAALLSSISAIHSCHLVGPSPHSEDPQVRAGGWLVTGDPHPPHPKTAPADLMPADRGAWQATVQGVARVGLDLATKQ